MERTVLLFVENLKDLGLYKGKPQKVGSQRERIRGQELNYFA